MALWCCNSEQLYIQCMYMYIIVCTRVDLATLQQDPIYLVCTKIELSHLIAHLSHSFASSVLFCHCYIQYVNTLHNAVWPIIKRYTTRTSHIPTEYDGRNEWHGYRMTRTTQTEPWTHYSDISWRWPKQFKVCSERHKADKRIQPLHINLEPRIGLLVGIDQGVYRSGMSQWSCVCHIWCTSHVLKFGVNPFGISS